MFILEDIISYYVILYYNYTIVYIIAALESSTASLRRENSARATLPGREIQGLPLCLWGHSPLSSKIRLGSNAPATPDSYSADWASDELYLVIPSTCSRPAVSANSQLFSFWSPGHSVNAARHRYGALPRLHTANPLTENDEFGGVDSSKFSFYGDLP